MRNDANINVYKSHNLHFALALIVSKILRFEMFDLEDTGQDHRVQRPQWSRPMANIHFYTGHN